MRGAKSWRVLRLRGDVQTEVADAAECDSGELLHFGGHGFENFLNAMEPVAPADCEDEIAEDFPIVVRVAGSGHDFIESLQAAFQIDHRTAFFKRRASGKDDMRGGCCCVG